MNEKRVYDIPTCNIYYQNEIVDSSKIERYEPTG